MKILISFVIIFLSSWGPTLILPKFGHFANICVLCTSIMPFELFIQCKVCNKEKLAEELLSIQVHIVLCGCMACGQNLSVETSGLEVASPMASISRPNVPLDALFCYSYRFLLSFQSTYSAYCVLGTVLNESERCSVMSNSWQHESDQTVHGILQARTLECVAFPFSRGSSQPRD